MAVSPLPRTLAELKAVVSRERRRVDRRVGLSDRRLFQFDRRIGERRSRCDDYPTIDDEMIIEITIEEVEPDFEDMTRIFATPG